MQSLVRYGVSSSLTLDFPAGNLLAHCGVPQAEPIADLAATVHRVLEEPLDYPALHYSATPGDRVVVTVDEGVPQASTLVEAVIRELVAAGVEADGITLLRTVTETRAGLGDPLHLPREVRDRLTFVTHDPANRNALAYLAATKSGEPILLNRAIVDADVVLPIGCVHRRWLPGYHGVHSPIFPTFSDQATQARFLATDTRRPGKARKDLVREVENVGWLLGVPFTVQVVPGPGETVLHLLAGEVGAVRRRGRELYEAAWRCETPGRAELVVAAIEGGREHQNWQNVGSALAVAERLVEEGGSIAICCDLAEEPGPAVQKLPETPNIGEALRRIRREHQPDALPAAQLARILERAKVYLLSRLDESQLEDLQIAAVTDPDDIVRLARRSRSCIIVSNAPYAVVTMEGE